MSANDWLLRRARVSSGQHKKITIDDKMTFFQQLASLVSSGTPLLQAIQICADQCQSKRLQAILSEVAGRVAGGVSLHAALAGHPGVFEDHWIALVGTGEVSGKMDQVLCDLNVQIRESRETMRKITGSLIYPVILLFVAILVIVVMLWYVVPTFGDMFEEMGAKLPPITQFVIDLSDYVANYGPYVIGGLGVAVFLFRKYLRTDAGLRRVTAIALATPMLGELMVQAAMYRFSSTLSLLLKSGVPILDTLTALGSAFRTNPVYRDALATAQHHVAAGRALADSLEDSRLFTTMMTNMVRIGEESSQLSAVMGQIAPYYKEKMNSFIGKATKLLEPCIIMGMGCTIAVVMLAIYIPMFEMSGNVK